MKERTNAPQMSDKAKKKQASNCETCANYVWDEDWEEYTCLVNLDEDEYARFISSTNYSCPYYRLDDEYQIAGKQ